MYVTCAYAAAVFFVFQAEDGIRDLVRSRGLGDVYKRQGLGVDVVGRAGAALHGHVHALAAIVVMHPTVELLSLIHI